MAVGYNNVDVNAVTKYGVAVGNTPVCSFFCRVIVFCDLWLSFKYIAAMHVLCLIKCPWGREQVMQRTNPIFWHFTNLNAYFRSLFFTISILNYSLDLISFGKLFWELGVLYYLSFMIWFAPLIFVKISWNYGLQIIGLLPFFSSPNLCWMGNCCMVDLNTNWLIYCP